MSEDLALHARRLETLLKNLPGMAYRCLNEPHWPMDFVSDGCFALCGYRPEEIESQAILWGDFTHPDDIDEVDRQVRLASRTQGSFEVEYRVIAKCGQTRWVWERGHVVGKRDDGVAILEGFITDITSRKDIETLLINSQAYSQAVVESAAEAVITLDEAGRIESFNGAACQMFCHTPEQARSLHCRQLISVQDRGVFDEFLPHQKIPPVAARSGCDVNGLKRTGEQFPVTLSISRIATDKDERYVMLARDLTRRHEQERQLREQRELLAHADRLNTLGEMAAAIAHEINQPLSAISSHAQSGLRFLGHKPPNLARVDEALELISAQARRAGAVIERIQSMARREERDHELIDVGTLVREIHRLAQMEANTRHFSVRLELDDESLQVRCDSVQMQQVILNLVRNGMESMSAAACPVNTAVLVRARSTNASIVFSVIDQGTGICEDVKNELFEPFQTSRPLGMGMGLAISRSIIAAHGSTLEYRNNKGAGATFYFSMPQEPDS